MDRLTREKIERIRRTGVSDLYEGDVDALCNDLEELQRLVKILADLAVTEPEIEQEFAHGPRVIFEKGSQITVRDVLMARKALKREPNAAAPVECCCAIHHPNYGRCLQCPIHGTLPPGASDEIR